MTRRFVAALLASLAIVSLFLSCTWFGLHTRLGYDDVMNLTFAWEPPLRDLVVGLITPFSSFYRPTGSAVYRLLFEAFGLNALAFRIFVYSLLLLNILLVFLLARLLSASAEIGAIAALLYAWHGRLADIYLNNGTLYDVLCCTLFLTCLLQYVTVRQRGARLRPAQWALFLILFVLALNAKEMAATMPAVLIAYELLFRRALRQYVPAAVCGAIVLAAAHAKMTGDSAMSGNPAYKLTFSLHQFLEHSRLLTADLFYVPGLGLSNLQLICIWLSAIALAWRSVFRRFALAFALLTPLAVVFIPFRGFFVMYLPLAGWAMFFSALLVEGLGRWLRPSVLFVAVGALAVWIPLHDSRSPRFRNDVGQEIITSTRAAILRVNEGVPTGAQLLFLHDRFPPEAFGTGMLCRLLYKDRNLTVDRPTMMAQAPDVSAYDRVFDYVDGRLTVVRRRPGGPGKKALNYPE